MPADTCHAAVRGAGGGAGERPRVRGDAPGPQAAERHPGRAGPAAHRLRHRARRGRDGPHPGRPGPGNPGVHRAGGAARGRGGGRRGRLRAGRDAVVRGDRAAAVRYGRCDERELPGGARAGRRGRGGAGAGGPDRGVRGEGPGGPARPARGHRTVRRTGRAGRRPRVRGAGRAGRGRAGARDADAGAELAVRLHADAAGGCGTRAGGRVAFAAGRGVRGRGRDAGPGRLAAASVRRGRRAGPGRGRCGGCHGHARTDAGRGGAAPSASKGAAAKPPAEYIEGNQISHYFWLPSTDPERAAHGTGACNLGPEQKPPGADMQAWPPRSRGSP